MDIKKTSAVWLHFEEQEGTDTAKCNFCRSLSCIEVVAHPT